MREAKPTVELRAAIKRQFPEDRVARAFQAIFVNRTSFSGIWSAGPLGGRDQRKSKITDRWRPENVVRALREARELLEGRLQVASMDAVAYVTCMVEEDPDGLYYLDPPYIQEGWQLYREIMTTGDHERLAAVLRQVPRWVLSYDLCEEVRALYSWASIQEVETCYTTAKTRGAKKRARRREVVVVPGGGEALRPFTEGPQAAWVAPSTLSIVWGSVLAPDGVVAWDECDELGSPG